jgi:flagellar hook-associated protein 3 FlgL
MTAYISTQTISSSLRQSILKMQSALAASQTELSTGNYADVGLVLGARASDSISLQAQSGLLKAISDTNSAIATRLDLTQNVLEGLRTGAQDLLNSLIETNGAATNTGPIQISGQTGLKSLIGSLNSTLNGDYIFAGINSSAAPVTDYYGASAPNKQAVDTAFQAEFGFSQSNANVSSISAAAMQSFVDNQFAPLFQGASWNSGWSAAASQTMITHISLTETMNTSVSANETAFQELAQAYTMLADLGTQNLGVGAYQAIVGSARTLLTSAIAHLTDLQAGVGSAQSNVTRATDQMSLQMNLLSSQIGSLESVNTYEVATRISDLRTQIETSYSLTSQLAQLSLVHYL